jgi:hypothetical protein
MYSKGVIGYEIVLSTKVKEVNTEILTKEEIKFFTHDSMYAMKRKVFSREEAIEKRIIKREFENEPHKDPYAAANNYACNSGLIVSDDHKSFAYGHTFSHGLMCQFTEN